MAVKVLKTEHFNFYVAFQVCSVLVYIHGHFHLNNWLSVFTLDQELRFIMLISILEKGMICLKIILSCLSGDSVSRHRTF